jgi:hypothetical protein
MAGSSSDLHVMVEPDEMQPIEARTDQALAVECVPMPWHPYACLDKVRDGRYVLSHVVTCEKVQVDAEYAELQFHADIDECSLIIMSGPNMEADFKDLDDLFERHLYWIEDSKERFIVEPRATATAPYSLEARLAKFRNALVKFVVNQGTARCAFQCYVFTSVDG